MILSKYDKILIKILSGSADNNINFNDLLNILSFLGFDMRIKGSHHILFKEDVAEIINIQPNNESKAKAYQVKQIRNLIIKYKLGEFNDE